MFDVIFNPKIIDKAEKEKQILDFLITLIAQRIFQKYQIEIQLEHTKLMNNFKYKGKQVKIQRVRIKTGPKIEEILEDNKNRIKNMHDSEDLSKRISNQVNEKGQLPQWNFYIYSKKFIEAYIINYWLFLRIINYYISY